MCLEGADETSYQKAENHLLETGGIPVSFRQIQRMAQKVGGGTQAWQERQAVPESCKAPIMYISADATGVPMRKEEFVGRKGKQEFCLTPLLLLACFRKAAIASSCFIPSGRVPKWSTGADCKSVG